MCPRRGQFRRLTLQKSPDWTGSNAWITISNGQQECNAVTGSVMPDPLPPDNFWDSLKHKAVEGTASYLVKAAVNEAVSCGGLGEVGRVDYSGLGDRAALRKRSTSMTRLGQGLRRHPAENRMQDAMSAQQPTAADKYEGDPDAKTNLSEKTRLAASLWAVPQPCPWSGARAARFCTSKFAGFAKQHARAADLAG